MGLRIKNGVTRHESSSRTPSSSAAGGNPAARVGDNPSRGRGRRRLRPGHDGLVWSKSSDSWGGGTQRCAPFRRRCGKGWLSSSRKKTFDVLASNDGARQFDHGGARAAVEAALCCVVRLRRPPTSSGLSAPSARLAD